MTDTELILADDAKLPVFSFQPVAFQMRESALVAAAEIGAVRNGPENEKCARVQKLLKGFLLLVESERKALKEPVLNAGRSLDAAVNEFRAEAEKELGRLEYATREFVLAEQRRVNEEQEIQRKRLEALPADDPRREAEAAPVEITRAPGQVVRKIWVVERINDFQLMKARPNLVRKIEWDMVSLKQALSDNDGKLPGVTAREDIDVSVRGARAPKAISV